MTRRVGWCDLLKKLRERNFEDHHNFVLDQPDATLVAEMSPETTCIDTCFCEAR